MLINFTANDHPPTKKEIFKRTFKHGNSVQNYNSNNKKIQGNLILIYVGQFLFAFHHNKKIHFYASRTEMFLAIWFY